MNKNSQTRIWINSVLCLLIVSSSQTLYAKTKEVVVQGRAAITNSVTLSQAKNQAINIARSLAVEQSAGVSVNTATLLQNSLIVAELINTLSFGYIIQEEVVNWSGEWTTTSNKLDPGVPVVEVTLRCLVSIPERSFYKNYVLDAKLDKKNYVSGESVNLSITAKEDLYILVVNYTSDNKIIPIYPNSMHNENRIKKNSTVELPGPYSDEFSISVNTIPGHSTDTEAFIVLGFEVGKNTSDIPWFDLFPAEKEINYSHFFNTLLQLPITWMAQKTLVYTVANE